jgi:Ribonuclease G/E
MTLEVFLDALPGETRGVVMRDGRFEHLLIDRDDDIAGHRLGARSVGRVEEVVVGLKGAFVDLGTGVSGFLPFRGGPAPGQGARVEVEVSAEPRRGKGPALRLVGAAEGSPRLLAPGPDVRAVLARLAPGVEPATGLDALQASREAEEEAASPGGLFPDVGLDLMVERTRALVAVDLDFSPVPGVATGGKARDRANREGLRQAARAIRLKRWAGLVAIDLIGANLEGPPILAAAKSAFGEGSEIGWGPISRFGVLQLTLPWRWTPLEELFDEPGGRRKAVHRAQDIVRSLKVATLTDTATARIIVRAAPEEVALAQPLTARLGPRVVLRADASVAPGAYIRDEE